MLLERNEKPRWRSKGKPATGQVVLTINVHDVVDIGVWDGNEWSTEFGNGEPVQWAPLHVAQKSD